MDDDLEKRFLYSDLQMIEFNGKIGKNEKILDIGGGGEGIIGKLYGSCVTAIDKSAEELNETQNESLKIVMDASDMLFLDSSFNRITVFYTFMYMPGNVMKSVIKECCRVLKKRGIIEIWDINIPKIGNREKDIFIADLEIRMANGIIKTKYGVLMNESPQTKNQIVKLCEDADLKAVKIEDNKDSFHLIFQKKE